MDIEDTTDSSQETFEMLGPGRKKKFTGEPAKHKCIYMCNVVAFHRAFKLLPIILWCF